MLKRLIEAVFGSKSKDDDEQINGEDHVAANDKMVRLPPAGEGDIDPGCDQEYKALLGKLKETRHEWEAITEEKAERLKDLDTQAIKTPEGLADLPPEDVRKLIAKVEAETEDEPIDIQ